MKHIIILGDGMADHPVKRLGDKTLLQYANTPYMDLLAKQGRSGMLNTIPEGFLVILSNWKTIVLRIITEDI